VLVLGFGVRLQRSLASLKRSYEKSSDTRLSDEAYERFIPELVAFLKTCITHAIEHLAQELNQVLKEKLARIREF